MNISSYNITDVSYHYVGLRVLSDMPANLGRRHQLDAISRGVRKFVYDRALRLMLPEPRGTFETTGEKVCQELVQLRLACSHKGGYRLSESGDRALQLLDSRQYVELRKLMVAAHLRTYDNLRTVLDRHLDAGDVWRPLVESARLGDLGYIAELLAPMLGQEAATEASAALNGEVARTSRSIETALHAIILRRLMPNQKIGVPLFRAMCDRLLSLRLLNIQRAFRDGCEFLRSYSPCVGACPARDWYVALEYEGDGGTCRIYLSEPDMADRDHQEALLAELDVAFEMLTPVGGYYDIPAVRDVVCEHLRIPEAAFDEGINRLLDVSPSVISVGLHYERISGRRRPLVRNRQIHNLVRRV